ncbi:hypothetical protein LPYR103PRE_06680 [Segatella asaccharophila]
MKKLIFSIAALAAIVVMGSCSQDSDLTNKTAESVGNVTVSLNVNSGIDVSESSSSLNNQTAKSETSTRAGISTRADGTAGVNNPTTDFAPTYPTSYTAYFVADGAQNGYTDKEIVRVVTINNAAQPTKDNPNVVTNTKITVPALKYNIIVTNYTLGTAPAAGGTWADFEASLPTSSTTLYLYGQQINDLSASATAVVNANVTLGNDYAAVCVAHNNFVSAAKYNVDNDAYSDGTNDNSGSGKWYYLYIRANSNDKKNTNSTLTIHNINNINSYTLSKDILAGNVYQYTINDNFTGGTSGNENGLTISITPFKEAITEDLSVY